jgi:hypothetical protein
MSGLKPGPISGARAGEEADPCGMTARKAKAEAEAKAKAKANAKANAGISPLRFASVEMTSFMFGSLTGRRGC